MLYRTNAYIGARRNHRPSCRYRRLRLRSFSVLVDGCENIAIRIRHPPPRPTTHPTDHLTRIGRDAVTASLCGEAIIITRARARAKARLLAGVTVIILVTVTVVAAYFICTERIPCTFNNVVRYMRILTGGGNIRFIPQQCVTSVITMVIVILIRVIYTRRRHYKKKNKKKI